LGRVMERGGGGGGKEEERTVGEQGRVFPLIHAKDHVANPSDAQTRPADAGGEGGEGEEDAGEAKDCGVPGGEESLAEAGTGEQDAQAAPAVLQKEEIARAVALLIPKLPVGKLTTPPASPRDEWKSPKASPRSGSRSGRSSR
jgi:hypothetical protein